jgi:Zinc carboxypeptidase
MTSFALTGAKSAMKASLHSRTTRYAFGLALFALLVAAIAGAPRGAKAEVVDPQNCTETVQFDPSIPTFRQVALARGFANPALGGFGNGTANRHVSAELHIYQEAIAAATVNNPRVRVQIHNTGPTEGGRRFQYSIISTPENLARVEQDAQFYREVRAGEISKEAALADVRANPRPAFGWITETPHGNEPAGGEASMRMLYELAARTDCANMRRLQQMTFFVDPARNPDGRDQQNPTRTTAWGFDPNRDLMYQTQDVNRVPLDEVFKYPSLFFIDAHQQAESYFFPPNEDPVHHEISQFSLDQISKVIGPAIQSRFNDQSLQYRNYNEFDLFVPEFGDSATSLINGAAGMTYEKGVNETYGKQVYDHYLAIDETLNVVTKEKDKLLEEWISQWEEATVQGANCEVQKNQLVSPLHDTITQQPDIDICGYYFKPGNHSGDTARILDLLQSRDVRVFRIDQPVTVQGAYDWGSGEETTQTLPAGTLWVPTAQTMKHWINATLEENPFIPYPFFFDVVNWSFSDLSSAGGNGQLQAPLPAATPVTEVTGNVNLGTVEGAEKPVLAFSTDSMEALALTVELLDRGATVFRSRDAFDAAGKHFPTGTALVDAATLGGIDIAALAAGRETPVTGLDAFPAARFPIVKPKIAVFTGQNAQLPNPLVNNGHCNNAGFCEMLFTLARQIRIPASMMTTVTSGEIANGVLLNQNFTALVAPNAALAATGTPSPASGLRDFVNAGGNYVTSGANGGLTSMRNAGMTTVNTFSTATWNQHCPHQNDPLAAGALTSPGTAYNAEFNTDNPVAWGFDAGGYIWRDSNSTNTNVVLDTATLAGNGGTIPAADTAVSYPEDLEAYGYQCNGLEPDRLPGRPYVVDQPFGAGHSTLIGSNPFLRAWSASTQRLVLNGILYPRAAVIPAAAAAKPVSRKAMTKPATRSLLRKQLPRVKARPVRRSAHRPTADVVLTVKAGREATLRKIVRKAKLPAKVAARIRWEDRSDGAISMRIVGAADFARNWRGDNTAKGQDLWVYTDRELRPGWAWRIINGLVKHRFPHQDQI